MPDQERIEQAVRSVLASMGGDITTNEIVLLAELEALGRTIAQAKAEIAALRVEEIEAEFARLLGRPLDKRR